MSSASTKDQSNCSNVPDDDLCQFCGESPADFTCTVAAGCKRLCRHCDALWHGHPDRRRHERNPLPHSTNWQCQHCTFDNPASSSGSSGSRGRPLVCAMCDRSPGPRPSTSRDTASASVSGASSSSNEAAEPASAQQQQQVPCAACTLLNPATSIACQLCESPIGPGSTPGNANNNNRADYDDSSDEAASAVAWGPSSAEAAERRRLLERQENMRAERRLLDRVTRAHESLASAPAAAAAAAGHPPKARRGSSGCTGFCGCGRG